MARACWARMTWEMGTPASCAASTAGSSVPRRKSVARPSVAGTSPALAGSVASIANGLEHRATLNAVEALDALGDVVIKLVLDLDAHDRHAAASSASEREVADVRTSGGKDVRHAGDEARLVSVAHDERALEAGDAHAHAIDASNLDLTAADGTAEHGHVLALRRGELNQGGVGMEALVLVIANHKERPRLRARAQGRGSSAGARHPHGVRGRRRRGRGPCRDRGRSSRMNHRASRGRSSDPHPTACGTRAPSLAAPAV